MEHSTTSGNNERFVVFHLRFILWKIKLCYIHFSVASYYIKNIM